MAKYYVIKVKGEKRARPTPDFEFAHDMFVQRYDENGGNGKLYLNADEAYADQYASEAEAFNMIERLHLREMDFEVLERQYDDSDET